MRSRLWAAPLAPALATALLACARSKEPTPVETVELERHESPEEQRAAMAIITREARRLIHLVENVLHVARAERRLGRVEPRPQPLAPLIAAAAESFRPIARAAGSDLCVDQRRSPHAMVDTDAFRQILLDLLDNAVRHGAPAQTVTVSAEARGEWARVVVADQGPGIPPGDRARVWAPFVRLDRADGAGGTGGGIGLAIVCDLVERQHGRFGIGFGSGAGARVFVELPLASAAAPE